MSSPNMIYSTLIQRVHRGLSAIELVHTSHPRWPLPLQSTTAPTVHISVLDSSFNPPTLAHLALANTLPPPPTDVPPVGAPDDFDRTEMMILLARELARTHARSVPAAQADAHSLPGAEAEEEHEPNVAVAIIDEPTFVGKSAILHDFLTSRIAALLGPNAPSTPVPSPELTFLMGTDTVARLFAPRYYASEAAMHTALHRFFSPDGDDSRIVCARRVSQGVPRAEEERIEVEMATFARTIAPFERLTFVDIGEREATYSSSQVRELRAKGDERWKEMITPAVAEYIVANDLYLTL